MDVLVVGLGNPGAGYEDTRHNIGFAVLDELARRCSDSPWREKWQGLGCDGICQGKKVFFLKPQTFMNRSGQSVSRYYSFFKIDIERILVVHDDLDMPLARIKLVKGGGNGGHNGIRSMASSLGDNGFFRLKVGIGRPGRGDVHPDFPVEKYVLSSFTADEQHTLAERMDSVFTGFVEFVAGDIPRATGILNSLKAP